MLSRIHFLVRCSLFVLQLEASFAPIDLLTFFCLLSAVYFILFYLLTFIFSLDFVLVFAFTLSLFCVRRLFFCDHVDRLQIDLRQFTTCFRMLSFKQRTVSFCVALCMSAPKKHDLLYSKLTAPNAVACIISRLNSTADTFNFTQLHGMPYNDILYLLFIIKWNFFSLPEKTKR